MSWLEYYHLLEKYNGDPDRAAEREKQAAFDSDPNKAAAAQRLPLEVWRRQNGLPYVMEGAYFRISSVNGEQGPDSMTVIEHFGSDDELMILNRADVASLVAILRQFPVQEEKSDDDFE